MKYFFWTSLIAVFTFFTILCNKNEKQTEQKEFTGLDLNPTLDSFTQQEVDRAIHFAHEEYGTPSAMVSSLKCVDSAREAVDIVKGKSFFTGVSLSKGGDTLFICPMAFKLTRSPDKTLYHVVLDLLIDYKIKIERVNKPYKPKGIYIFKKVPYRAPFFLPYI